MIRKALPALLGLTLALGAPPDPAQAQEAQAQKLAESLALMGAQLAMARGASTLCDERDPAGAAARSRAFDSWAETNQIRRYEAFLKALDNPNLNRSLAQAERQIQGVVGQILEAKPEICEDLGALLGQSEFDMRGHLDQAITAAHALGVKPEALGDAVEELEAATPSAGGEGAQRLSQFSAEALRIMAQAALIPQDDASEIREARGDHLEEVLKARGPISVSGRVVDDDELREWVGDSQSIATVTCRNFEDAADMERMKAGLGAEMIVSGRVRWASEHQAGARVMIALNGCRLRAGVAAQGEAPAAGLTPRPPDAQEAYGGPGQGIALKDVARVLHQASFNNRLDGFGNFYTDRDEHVFLLLRDGTAYRHDWGFPFGELDLELLKRRDPENWFRWAQEGDEVVLTDSEGERRELDDAQALQTPPAGLRLERHFYYLNVGMGGGRTDRGLTFSRDGGIVMTRGGFVAGYTAGGGFLSVTGPDDPPVRGRYRFEDFTLVVATDHGEERYFFGVPADEDLKRPENVVFQSSIYWTKKD